MKEHSVLFLIFCVILGWSCYSGADIIAKYLSSTYVVPQILATAGLLGTIVSGIWIYSQKGISGFFGPKFKWHILRGVFIFGIAFCFVSAVSLAPMADVYGVSFTAPFIGLIMISLILKEPVGWRRWAAVAVGFAGVLILLGAQFDRFNSGLLYACLAAFFIGSSIIIVRKIGKGEYLPVYAFYPFLMVFLMAFPLALPDFKMPQNQHLGLFLVHGCFVMGGHIFATYAIAHVRETALLSPFMYVQIIWGTLFGIFLFGDIPSKATTIGLALIIGAGLYSIWREHINYKKYHSL